MMLSKTVGPAPASPASLKTFGTTVQEAVQQLCTAALDYLASGIAAPEAQVVANALSNLGRSTRASKARLVTTNYDDLIAHLADLNVLLLDGRYFRPVTRLTGAPVAEFTPDYTVPEIKRRFHAWDQIDFCSAAPAQSASVLHLHGWHGQADSIVIDPVDYHEITTTDQGRRDEFAAMVRQCNDTIVACMLRGPCIYVGTAWGMVDTHLEMLRQQARDEMLRKRASGVSTSASSLTETNFWIVNEKFDGPYLDAWFRRMGHNSVSVVLVKDPQEAAQLLLEITALIL
jgi:hypothetical protein